jgi:hypothetical protein
VRNELFLYWRTSRADLPAAREAMLAFQQSQSLAESGLQARLMVRLMVLADEAADTVTLMETYALPAAALGIGDALRQRIVEGGNAASEKWRAGVRHLEVFSEVDPAEDAKQSPPAG